MLLTLVNFSGRPESDSVHHNMSAAGSENMEEEEIDESILDENEEEAVMMAKKEAEARAGGSKEDDNPKESDCSEGSVGSLATNFLKSVTVGSNDVFATPKFDSHNTIQPKVSAGQEQSSSCGAGLPREYKVDRAARHN